MDICRKLQASTDRPNWVRPIESAFFIETCFALINQSPQTSVILTAIPIATFLPHRIGISGPCIARQGQKCCLCDRCTLYCYFETLYIEMLFSAGSLCTFDLTQSFWPLTQLVQKKILTQLHNRMFYFVLIKVIWCHQHWWLNIVWYSVLNV